MMKKSKQAPLKSEDLFESVYSKTLNFLSYKERTPKELDTAIDKYLFKSPISESEKSAIKLRVLDEIDPAFLVSDEAYVKDYVMEVIETRRLVSKRQIAMFLFKKGVPSEIISEYVDKYYTQSVEEEIILALCEKKLRGSGFQDRAKLTRYLISKGFSPSAVYTVVDTKFKRY